MRPPTTPAGPAGLTLLAEPACAFVSWLQEIRDGPAWRGAGCVSPAELEDDLRSAVQTQPLPDQVPDGGSFQRLCVQAGEDPVAGRVHEHAMQRLPGVQPVGAAVSWGEQDARAGRGVTLRRRLAKLPAEVEVALR